MTALTSGPGGKLAQNELWLTFPGVTVPEVAGEEAECSASPPPPPLPQLWKPHCLSRESDTKFPICPHADPPSVSAVHAVVLAAVGQEAVLACEASGVPPPRLIWYRGTRGGERALGTVLPGARVPGQSLGWGRAEWGVWGEMAHSAALVPPPTVHAADAAGGEEQVWFWLPGRPWARDLASLSWLPVWETGKPQMVERMR